MYRFLVFISIVFIHIAALSDQPKSLIPAPPKINAKSYFLMDANTGTVIAQKAADERLNPASLTKVMTAYVVDYEIEQGTINYDDVTTVSKKAWAKNYPGSSLMFLEVGKKVNVLDLMKGLIISSGNDAAVALAEHTAGSEKSFVDLMNQHAKILGLNNTQFSNVHGLTDKNNYSTARDMALLSQAVINQFPESYGYYADKSFTYNGIKQYNRNRLLWRDNTVDGLKTGHTDAAGFCLIASAKREDTRLIAVLMGTSSEEARAREAQKLFSYGFRYFETKKLYDADQVIQQFEVWGGREDSVGLKTQKAIYVTVPKTKVDDIQAKMVIDQYLKAPLNIDQSVGKLLLSLDGEVLSTFDLYPEKTIAKGGLFKVIWSNIKLFFYRLFN